MKKIYLSGIFSSFIILICSEVIQAQSELESGKKSIYITAAPVYSYSLEYKKDDDYFSKEYTGFLFGIAADLWGYKKDIIGIEFYGFFQKRENNPDVSELRGDFSVYYRRNIYLSESLIFFPCAGIEVLSIKSFGYCTLNGDLGIAYKVGFAELFIKNSFRLGSFYGKYTKWFFSAGISITL